MDWRELAGQIAAVAEKVAPLVVPGAGAAIQAGKEVLDLVDRFKTISGQTTPELEAARAELEPRVLRHLEDTASSLD